MDQLFLDALSEHTNDHEEFDLGALHEGKTVATGEQKFSRIKQGSMKVSFHSNNAVSLFRGTKADPSKKIKGSIGLTKFDMLMRPIVEASSQDDPYADQLLLDIENAISNSESTILRCQEFLDSKFKKALSGNISLTLATSQDPVNFDVALSTEVSRKLLWEILSIDQLTLKNITAQYRAIIDKDVFRSINVVMRKPIKEIYSLAYNWRPSGVTREDVIAKNQRAILAADSNKRITLTDEVLQAKTRAKFAPDLKVTKTEEITPLISAEEKKAAEIENAIAQKKLNADANFSEPSVSELSSKATEIEEVKQEEPTIIEADIEHESTKEKAAL